MLCLSLLSKKNCARIQVLAVGFLEGCRLKRNRNYHRFACFYATLAQLVRALDCGSRGHGFESRRWYHIKALQLIYCNAFLL